MLGRVFKKVFSQPAFLIVSLLAALVLFLLILWLQNFSLLGSVFQDTISFWQKVSFFYALIPSLPSVLGWFQTIVLVIISLLFGLTLGMNIFYLEHAGLSSLKSVSGLVIALLGLGCASCGALFLAPLLGATLAGALAFIPFGQVIFSLLGIALLVWSAYAVGKKIDNPYV